MEGESRVEMDGDGTAVARERVMQQLQQRPPEKEIIPFEPENVSQMTRLAEGLSRSALIPRMLQGKVADTLVILLAGRELGLTPMQSLRGIFVVDGKPSLSADLMVALAQRRPECEWFRLVESTAKVATYETKRKGHPSPVKLSFTWDEATAAGLTGKDNWRKYGPAMLRARCSSALARAVYQDFFFGTYTPDEVGGGHAAVDMGMADVRVVEPLVATPQPKTTKAEKDVEKPREQPGEDPFPELGAAEPPAASGAAPAGAALKGARSYSGLTKAEWEALPASEQTARGDISKQQLVAIGNLARKIGLDEAAVMQSLRTSTAYRAEFETHGMGEYWQLSATMASATISQLSAG